MEHHSLWTMQHWLKSNLQTRKQLSNATDFLPVAFVVYTAPLYPIFIMCLQLIKAHFYFFGKKTGQSVNYNKNGCKFAKRVNTKSIAYSIDLSS